MFHNKRVWSLASEPWTAESKKSLVSNVCKQLVSFYQTVIFRVWTFFCGGVGLVWFVFLTVYYVEQQQKKLCFLTTNCSCCKKYKYDRVWIFPGEWPQDLILTAAHMTSDLHKCFTDEHVGHLLHLATTAFHSRGFLAAHTIHNRFLFVLTLSGLLITL